MSAISWIATAVMTIVALSFLLKPLAGNEHRALSVDLAIALPVFAAGVYIWLGSPGIHSAYPHAAAINDVAETGNQPAAESISSLVDGLAARLEENPEDSKGWLLLAKSYEHLNRLDDARYAYAMAGPAVTGSVDLSPALRTLVEPTDMLFIFARAPGQAGAPIAVVHKPAATWPVKFRLTDSQSMVEGMRLSSHDEVIVTARLSRSGDTANTLKGLEAKSPPIAVSSTESFELIIE